MGDKLHELISSLKELAKELGRTPTSREFIKSGHSNRKITSHGGYNNLVIKAGLEVNSSPQTAKPITPEIRPPRILVLDIEVCAATAYSYQFRDAYISPDQIISMPYILSYAAKWYGEDKIYYLDTRFSPKDDRHILEALHYLMSEADYIAGHNAKSFDLKTIKGRMIELDMEPLPDIKVWDTFRIALKHFKFPFYKLGELAKYLKCENAKLSHSKYPGNTLFIEADKGNMDAFNEMELYNKADVVVTEEILTKLAKWESLINVMVHEQSRKCICGSVEFRKEGFHYTKSGAKQRYRCVGCSKIYTSKDNLVDKDVRKGLLN